jgi:hypothetical protein
MYTDEWKKCHITDLAITDTLKQIRKDNIRESKKTDFSKDMPEPILSEYNQQKKLLDDRGADIEKLKKGLITADYFTAKWS